MEKLKDSWSRTMINPGLGFRLRFLICTNAEMTYDAKINENREIDSAEVKFHISTPYDWIKAKIETLFRGKKGYSDVWVSKDT